MSLEDLEATTWQEMVNHSLLDLSDRLKKVEETLTPSPLTFLSPQEDFLATKLAEAQRATGYWKEAYDSLCKEHDMVLASTNKKLVADRALLERWRKWAEQQDFDQCDVCDIPVPTGHHTCQECLQTACCSLHGSRWMDGVVCKRCAEEPCEL